MEESRPARKVASKRASRKSTISTIYQPPKTPLHISVTLPCLASFSTALTSSSNLLLLAAACSPAGILPTTVLPHCSSAAANTPGTTAIHTRAVCTLMPKPLPVARKPLPLAAVVRWLMKLT